jgi:hypothetical protein
MSLRYCICLRLMIYSRLTISVNEVQISIEISNGDVFDYESCIDTSHLYTVEFNANLRIRDYDCIQHLFIK